MYIDLVPSYSTDSFLLVLRRFVALHGYPAKLHSDNGSQLAAASKKLNGILKGLDWKDLVAFGAEHGLQWSFTSADALWQNGCVEALIKSCKKALSQAIGSQCLSFSELQTVLFEVAHLLNERPIGRHPTDPSDGTYLCPNDLLLGRATTRVPAGPFKEQTNHKQRFEFVQQVVNSFWKKMTRDYFSALTIRPKWHVQRRNVKVGDVVLMQDSNSVRGEWKLARVSKIVSGGDGNVRNCEVQYKHSSSVGKFTTLKRAVQRLIVVVPVDEDAN